jgi:hypothetical protein
MILAVFFFVLAHVFQSSTVFISVVTGDPASKSIKRRTDTLLKIASISYMLSALCLILLFMNPKIRIKF